MSRDTSVVLELKAKVEALTKELADAKLQLGNALTANSALEQRLAAESEDDLNFAAETGVKVYELQQQLVKAKSDRDSLWAVVISGEPLADFDSAWAKMEAQGYQYGGEALEQVRLGWFMAQEALAEWRKSRV